MGEICSSEGVIVCIPPTVLPSWKATAAEGSTPPPRPELSLPTSTHYARLHGIGTLRHWIFTLVCPRCVDDALRYSYISRDRPKLLNLAMILKQAWRFFTQPDALVTRIFKARYFPNCSFLDSNVGYNLSFIWRGIWTARNLIKSGTRYHIGNGSSVRI